jgi:predicted nucleotidyltransferase
MNIGRPLATVTPTVDGDVLSVLAQNGATFTPGSLRRLLGRYSEAGIRNVLMRLTEQGIVHADRVGNAVTYRLNRDHLAAGPIIELAHLQRTLLTRIEEHLAGWSVPPVYAAVFGSSTRGEMTSSSDLDLLLVRPDDASQTTWGEQVAELSRAVSAWTGNDTRALEFTSSEVAGAAQERVLQDIARDGLTVAGSRAWLTHQLRHDRT